MFDIGWSELLVIAVVALIVIGPKELPAVLRTVGQWTSRIRRMAGEFQNQFQEAMREAEMADLKKHADDLNQAARSLAAPFDPMDFAKAAEPATPAPATAAEVPPAPGAATGEAAAAPELPLPAATESPAAPDVLAAPVAPVASAPMPAAGPEGLPAPAPPVKEGA